MKKYALFANLEEKKQQNLKRLSAANYRWRFMGLTEEQEARYPSDAYSIRAL